MVSSMIEVGPHIDFVLAKLRWMREQKIWPNGLRYLWTDAFGVVLLVSLYKHSSTNNATSTRQNGCLGGHARVLGRRRGIRIGEAPDRDGQYFHYLAMWMFALARLGDLKPSTDIRAFNWRATFTSLCHSRQRRHLENAGRLERALFWLWSGRSGRLRRLCQL